MSEIRDRVKAELFEIVSHYAESFCLKVQGLQSFQSLEIDDYIKRILSIKIDDRYELAIVDREEKFPDNPCIADRWIKKAGWVKEVKE